MYYGLAQLGAVFVPLNPRFTAEAGPRRARPGRPPLRGDRRPPPGRRHRLGAAGRGRPGVLDDPEVHETDADVIFFTSGTTGAPKGAMLSHRSNRLRTVRRRRASTGGRREHVPAVPLGGLASTHEHLARGRADRLRDAPHAETSSSGRAAPGRSTYADPGRLEPYLAAISWSVICSHCAGSTPGPRPRRWSCSTGSPRPFPADDDHDRLRVDRGERACARLPGEDLLRKPGSVGRPAPGLRAPRIEDGELWVTHPAAVLGYFRNPDATNAALVDGWYRTGDLVERDDEGYYRWWVGSTTCSDRRRDGRSARGRAGGPQRHPAVADGAVAASPTTLGQVRAAFVVLRPGTGWTRRGAPPLRAPPGRVQAPAPAPRRRPDPPNTGHRAGAAPPADGAGAGRHLGRPPAHLSGGARRWTTCCSTT